ncbi:unnamed protein product [Blepharisma stoltei]|uniref:EGF-like domain-containing protein n=1 Tax=Blepharisma stoltei TaxID=1481888 RepID=A0AAU9IHD9_9CILI|nr:unnamed protein product [Blepharisma stoltei]
MRSQLLFCCLLSVVLLQASEVHDSLPSNDKGKVPWQLPKSEGLYKEPTESSPFTSENPHWRALTTPASCPPGKSSNADGSTCVTCGDLCAYCADFTQACLQCMDPNRMEIGTGADMNKCKCKGSQTLSGTTCQCATDADWFDGSTCQNCPNQGEFYDATQSLCTSCATTQKMKMKTKIKAKESPSCCADKKYYNSNQLCQDCGANCDSCADTTGNCIKCSQKLKGRAIIKIKKTSCCLDGQFNGGTAGNTCMNCQDTNCNICSDGATNGATCLECKKKLKLPSNLVVHVKKTSCCSNSNEFWKTPDNQCKPCPDTNCASCQDGGDGTACIQCKNTVKMAGVKVKLKKTSCCDSGKHRTGSSCVNCSDNCLECKDVTGDCISCSKKVKGATIVDVSTCCSGNTYYSLTAVPPACVTCPDTNCDDCQNVTGNCLTCSKKVKFPAITVGHKKMPSCCLDNKYKPSGSGACTTCADNCNDCADGDGSCIKCSNLVKFRGAKVKLKKTSCCADDNKYWNAGQCNPCNSHCLMCQDVSGDCIKCEKDFKGSAPRINIGTCCDPGKYYKSGSCQACPVNNCDLCENITGLCIECSKKVKLPQVVAKVKTQPSCCINDAEYRPTGGSSCISCPTNCDYCNDGDGSCIQCSGLMKFRNIKVKVKKTSCCSDDNKYWTSNNQCDSCNSHCLMCQDVSGDCMKCEKTFKGIAPKVNIGTCCDPGEYYKSGADGCKTCPVNNCDLCENITGKCIECSKKVKLPQVVAKIKTQPSCCINDAEYWPTGGSSCTSCPTNCDYCNDGGGSCIQCSGLMKFRNIKVKVKKTSCCADDNKYWASNNQCDTCSSHCLMCQDVSGDCMKCEKYFKGSSLKVNVGTCCDPGEYYKSGADGCKTCPVNNCDLCENITGKCIECSKKVKFPQVVAKVKKQPSCCIDGKYWPTGGSSCTSCPTNCDYCNDGGGSCIQCSDLMKFRNIKVKVKKTSCCADDNKYWTSNNQCDTCSSHCLMCQDVSGDCINCEKYFKGSSLKVNVGTCCDPGKYYQSSGAGCQTCPVNNCDLCENITGKCIECSKKVKFPQVVAKVKKQPSCCIDGKYWPTGGSSCTSCPTNCDYCNDGGGSCIQCSDLMKFRNIKVKVKKTSCCADDNKYWTSNNQCDTCSSHCLMCQDVSGDCINCEKYFKGSSLKVNVGTCCDPGKYYQSSGAGCQTCPVNNCDLCENITGKCIECSKKVKFPQVVAKVKKQPSCCIDGKYWPTGGSSCTSCPTNCDYCNDGDGSCIQCSDLMKFRNIKVKVKKTSCCADDNKYWTSNNQCDTCSSHCLMCQDVSGDCINCEKYFKGSSLKVNVGTCCDPGNYYKASVGCSACPDTNCDFCENITGNCLACSTKVKFPRVVAKVKKQPSCCIDGKYWPTSGSSCINCPTNCDYCNDGDGSCIQCSNLMKIRGVKAKLKKTSCCADDNKYWTSNNQCDVCPGTHCLMCQDVSGDCINCEKYFKGHSLRVNVGTCCAAGKYYKSQALQCQPCPDQNCDTCENITGNCFACSKKVKIHAVAGVKKVPSCCSATNQYYNNSQKKCLNCATNCDICEDVSADCLQCSNKFKFSAKASAKKTSCCAAGKFWNDTTKKCESCAASCTSCEDVTGLCICSKKFSFRAKAGIKPTSCCASGKYWDTTCKACQSYCFECVDGTGDCMKCDEQFSVKTTVFNPTGSCCPDGFYYQGGSCHACTKPCATCTTATKCTSCTELATYDKTAFTCTCKSGYYKSSTDCELCKAPCKVCSSESVCSSCRAHATLDASTKLCSCDSGYTLTSSSITGYCAANCNSLCTECNTDDGNKCTKCVTNAELTGSKCACTANSSFDSNSKTCVCNSGYTLMFNKCIGCKKYLASTDVKSASFSTTWTSINIYFNAKVDTKLDPTCSKVFNSTTLGLLGTGPVCSWLDQKTLKVALGSLFTLRGQTMYLDGTYLVKDSSDSCSLTYQPLSVVPTTSVSPSPTAALTGPSSASLSCGSSSEPLKYSGEKSTMSIGSMSYAWSSTISPTNSKLSDYIKSQKTSSISIAKSYFDISTTTTLNLTLQVTNYFGLKSSAWLVTTVTGESSLSVIFDQGNSISMKASSSSTIKAKLSTLCSNSASSSFSWTWKYYSGPTIDSTSILQNANNDKLTIKKNALAAKTDTPYVFMAIASQTYNGASISGNSTISITVTSSPLSIQLSKTSGDVSPDSDYTIDASGSKDPDDSTVSLTYLWTCTNTADASTCVGGDGKTLLDSEASVNLKIPATRLVKGAQWDIKCTISKDTRTASATVTLTVLSTTATAKAEIVLSSEKFNPQGTNKFSASVTSSYSPTLQWSVTSGQDIAISPNYLSTVSLPSGTLTEGNSYTFTLSISAQGKSFTVHLPINANLGATCTGTAASDPTTGNALTTSFKLSVDGCYDKDEEDYPLTYRYLDVTGGKTYTLGYTTEVNYLSTYLFPNENAVTIRVCDSLVTCSDYSITLTISAASSRRLESSSLMEAYLESTIDSDNVPASISLFCGSATIDSELFAKMWSDLQSYVASTTVDNDRLQNALGAAYSMTTQTEQMSAEMFTTMATWLAGVIVNNPSLVPSQENMVTVVALVNNYLSYGYNTNYVGMSLEDYIINADKFLTEWEIAATLDDLVTQSAMDGSQNTDMTKVFKYRDFPSSMVNHTARIGTNQTFSIPTNLSYADTDVMNIKLHYYNLSDESSDIVMMSFANSGSYVNYELQTSTETYVPFSTSDYPFVLELPINKDLGRHYAWGCLFYNETSKTWVEDGCEISEIKNNSIVFEVYHFSMFKLTQTEVVIPNKPSSSSCDDNYAPIYILVVTLFVSIIFAPILSFIDSKHQAKKVKPVLHDISFHPESPAHFLKKQEYVDTENKNEENVKAPNNPAGSLALESIQDEQIIEPIPNPPNVSVLVEKEDGPSTPKTPNDVKGVPTKGGVFTEFQSSDPVLSKAQPDEEEVNKEEFAETELQSLLEGHLLFGLIYFRNHFPRAIRLFILITVIVFELLLEGLLIYGFENISKGKSASTETLFNDYEAVYFGYTILALLIATPIELFMISAFAIDRSKAPMWSIAAVIVGISVLIGSIIGIVLLNIDFCFEWSGYWAISFLYGILVQVFVVETLYMIGRYFTVQFSSR